MARDRFLADCMLGKLARWMMLMGHDVKYIPRVDDGEIERIAMDEDRLLLTRDRRLAQRHNLRRRTLLIQSQVLEEQVREASGYFGFPISGNPDSSRCSLCNAPIDPVDKESVADLVPEYTFETQNEFGRCRNCGKIYWKGTHWEKMARMIDSFRSGSD